jgi:hypothetical protein
MIFVVLVSVEGWDANIPTPVVLETIVVQSWRSQSYGSQDAEIKEEPPELPSVLHNIPTDSGWVVEVDFVLQTWLVATSSLHHVGIVLSNTYMVTMIFAVLVPVEGWDAKILQFHFNGDKPCVPKHRLPWKSPGGSPEVPWRFPGASLEVPGGSPKVLRRFPGASRPTEQACASSYWKTCVGGRGVGGASGGHRCRGCVPHYGPFATLCQFGYAEILTIIR